MTERFDNDEAVRRWDRHAQTLMSRFGEEGDLHRVALLNPALFELVGDVEGKAVLDAGCGEGYLSRMLAGRGARVTAVDASAEMLAIARVLRPGGRLVFSILHPCFSAPGCGWIRNYRGDRLLWRSDNYFHEGPYEQPWPLGAPDGVIGYHRTLTSYFAAVRRAGFRADALVEPKPSDEVLEKYPQIRDDLRMAHFIVFGCSRD